MVGNLRVIVCYTAIWQAAHKKIHLLRRPLLESILATAPSGYSHHGDYMCRRSGWRNDKPSSLPQIFWHHDLDVSHCIRLLVCMPQNHHRLFSTYMIDHFRWRFRHPERRLFSIHVKMLCVPRNGNLFSSLCHFIWRCMWVCPLLWDFLVVNWLMFLYEQFRTMSSTAD